MTATVGRTNVRRAKVEVAGVRGRPATRSRPVEPVGPSIGERGTVVVAGQQEVGIGPRAEIIVEDRRITIISVLEIYSVSGS